MDGVAFAAGDSEYEDALRLILAASRDDDVVQGGVELPLVQLEDPWRNPAARQVMLHLGCRRTDTARARRLGRVRLNTLGCPDPVPDMLGLLTMPQAELDFLRASHPAVEPFLDAARGYLTGGASFSDAFAPCTSLWSMCRHVRLSTDRGDHQRSLDIWRLRLQGSSGHEIASSLGVSGQRVYQLNRIAEENFLKHLEGLQTSPLAASLFAYHLDTAGSAVLRAGVDETGVVRGSDIERLAWEVLPSDNAFVLTAVHAVRSHASAGTAELLAWEPRCAGPLAGGWTLLPLADGDVAAVREAHEATAIGGWLSFVPEITARTGLGEARLAAALRFAGLGLVGEAVIPARSRASIRRPAAVANILRAAPRPLHATEIFDQLLGLGDPGLTDVSYRTLILDLQDDPEVFRQHGDSVFSVVVPGHTAAQAAEVTEDPRPVGPDALFDPAAPSWSAPASFDAASWAEEAFNGDFIAEVAATLLDRRDRTGERGASVGELIHADEGDALLRWARTAPVPLDDTTEAGRDAVGMTLLAAHCAAARLSDAGGRDTWRILFDVAGPGVRDFMFHPSEMLRGRMLDAVVRAIHALRLRRAWPYNCDNWITALRLQCGFHHGDTAHIRDWILAPENLPPALCLLSHDTATGVARLLADIRLAVAGRLSAAEVHARHAASPWWPCWTAAEFADGLVRERRSYQYQPGPHAPAPEAQPQAQPPVPRPTIGDDPPEDLLGRGAPAAPYRVGAPVPPQEDGKLSWQVSLSPGARSYLLTLPACLTPGEGAVAVICDGARVGVRAAADGTVTWFAEGGTLALPLSGPRVRQVRLERERLPARDMAVELWAADAYLRVVDLRTIRPALLNPYRSRLALSAPVALLCHAALVLSHAPLEERPLDDEHRLMLFPAGLPEDFAVSCEGEVVWQPFPPEAGREVLDLPGACLFGDGASVSWGGEITLQPMGLPTGFEPTRALVGGQSLRADPAASGGNGVLSGYRVLPGMTPLLRQGRLDGVLEGRKVSIPLSVLLRRPPRGAALHNGERWQGIPPEGFWLDRSRNAGHRLWSPCPEGADVLAVMFDGARPVAAVGQHGVTFGRGLFGLGEEVGLGRGGFDQSDPPLAVAPCRDSGLVRRASLAGAGAVLHLSSPLGAHAGLTAVGWSKAGLRPLAVEPVGDGSALTVPTDGDTLSGIAIFAGGEWQGTAFLIQPVAAVANLLLSPDPAAALGFALDAHLPVLHEQIRKRFPKLLDRTSALAGVLLARSGTTVGQHAATVLLSAWSPPGAVGRAMMQAHLAASDVTGRALTDLECLAAAAPTAVIQLLPSGWDLVRRIDRPGMLARIAVSALPQSGLVRLAARGVGCGLPEVEDLLIEEAVAATRCDPNFLASRSEASVLSLAWAFLKDPRRGDMPRTLQTVLTLPSLRRWLNAALLRRLLNEAR